MSKAIGYASCRPLRSTTLDDDVFKATLLPTGAAREIIISMKTVVLSDAAVKDLLSLPQDAQDSIEDGLNEYAISGRGQVLPLKGSTYRRLRIGCYRIIFAEDAITILAIYIGKRETTTYRKGRL